MAWCAICAGRVYERRYAGAVILYAVYATSIGALSEVWGEVQLAAGATERLVEILQVEPVIQPPANPKSLPQPPQGHIANDNVTFHYPTRPEISALSGFSLCDTGRDRGIGRRAGAGKSTVPIIVAFMTRKTGVSALMMWPCRT